MLIRSAKELDVYQAAYALAMRIFSISCDWPKVELYALTDQVRRSSRSVCTNLREAWAKRRYEAHFVSKLSDCDGENGETDTWLDFARDANYISADLHAQLTEECRRIGGMLGKMLANPTPFILKR